MKIKIVYFAYLAPDMWEKIVIEQLDSLKKLDLYDIALNIYMSVISDDIELDKLKILLKNNYDKIELKNIYKENVYEYPGLKTIYQIAEDDDETYLLYFHSKGMTSNDHNTRQAMFKYTIENYKEGINEFISNKDLDVVCAIPHVNGYAWYNFFWVRSSYVRNYCSYPEITTDRFVWEKWIGTEFSRKKKIITYSPIIKYDQTTTHIEAIALDATLITNYYESKKDTEIILPELNTSSNLTLTENFNELNTSSNLELKDNFIIFFIFVFVFLFIYILLNYIKV